jgi:L-fucose isomerase-like protein
MSNVDTSGLPPEMQQRIADIIAKAQASVPGAPAAQAPGPTQAAPSAPAQAVQPSLMDHAIALRQEVAAMRQEVANQSEQLNAVAQVVDAVGQAVGQLYATFQATTAPTNHSATYS